MAGFGRICPSSRAFSPAKHRVRAMPKLLHHHQFLLRRYGDDVHPVGAINHKEIMLRLRARRHFPIRAYGEDSKIPERLCAGLLPGANRVLGALAHRVNRRSAPANSEALFLCRPALLHQAEQMRQGRRITAPFFRCQLPGPFVQLRRHRHRICRRATQRNEAGGEFDSVHCRTQEPRMKPAPHSRFANRARLLHRIARHDLDALQGHAFERSVARGGGRGGNLLQHIVAFD